jgi:hypothetical protein
MGVETLFQRSAHVNSGLDIRALRMGTIAAGTNLLLNSYHIAQSQIWVSLQYEYEF